MSRSVVPCIVAAVMAAGAGCGDAGGGGDGGALGGSAEVRTLARAAVESKVPEGARWVAWRVELEPGERIAHRHALSTVYGQTGDHRLDGGDGVRDVPAGGGAIVQDGRRHVHRAAGEPAVFWEVLLTSDASAPAGLDDAERIFATEPLEGIPQAAEIAFLEAVLPPGGGRTTVHTHPGPETIYVTAGPFDYQNAIDGTKRVDAGALESIPPGTAVQKRNPGGEEARFLSWFVVDPDEEFAPEAGFGG